MGSLTGLTIALAGLTVGLAALIFATAVRKGWRTTTTRRTASSSSQMRLRLVMA